jgi:hypothetical protein
MATVLVLMLLISLTLRSEDLLTRGVQFLDRNAVEAEFDDLTRLRAMPTYESVRTSLADKRFGRIRRGLAKLGVPEQEVDQLLWATSGADGSTDIYGILLSQATPFSNTSDKVRCESTLDNGVCVRPLTDNVFLIWHA